MALLYRAIWTDDRDQLDEELWQEAHSWIWDKHGIDLPGRGDIAADHIRAEVRHADTESGRVLRVLLHEVEPTGRTWTTTATSLEPHGGDGTLWVDVDCDDPRSGARIDIASPKLVRSLIDRGQNPRRGDVGLSVKAQAVRPNEVGALASAIADPARTVPVVVLSHDDLAPQGTSAQRGVEAAEVLSGIARVLMLPPDAIDPFIEFMGREFAVWGGAMRIYLPGWTEGEDPSRHRVILPRQFSSFPRLPGLLVARRLASSVGRQRPPDVWDDLRPSLARPGEPERLRAQQAVREEVHRRIAADARADATTTGIAQDGVSPQEQLQRENDELTELLALGDAEHRDAVNDLQVEMSRLRQQLAQLQDQVIDAVDELDQTVAERDREAAQARKLAIVIARAGVTEDNWTDAEGATAIDQVVVEAPSEAVEQARLLLDFLAIHDDACGGLERLDAALESRAWGATTWRGLRALSSYAQDVRDNNFTGGFWSWCEKTGRWPATSKKLAMSESETVMSSPKLARLRDLPVDPAVVPSGLICMQAHLKIATGGGMNIPRVYFHDDTGGSTGKVHIGFIGPHDLMPNKSTN